MSKREKIILAVMTAIFGIMVIMLGILTAKQHNKPKSHEKSVVIAPFSAPEFDEDAVSGEPQNVNDETFQVLNMADFSFKLCGEPEATDDGASLWLTNLAVNPAWMRAEIHDENGNLLGTSGVIKTDSYIQTVHTDSPLSAGQKIAVKVFFYEPETYYSMGTFTLNLVCKE